MTTPSLVTKTININTTPSKVWKALTSPDLLKLWMSDTEIEITSNWTIGSPIIIRGKVNGPFEYQGNIIQFEPGKILAYTSWSRITRLPDLPENYAVLEFLLTPSERGTLLTFTHSNLIAEAAYEHSGFYWTSALQKLKQVVEAGTSSDTLNK